MAMTRTRVIGLIAVVAVVVVAAAVGYIMYSGDKNAVARIISSGNVIKIEAAGVNYGGWPDVSIRVNGQEISKITIESPTREMYTFNVPNSVGDVSTIELKLLNPTDCAHADFSHLTAGCTDRALTVRGIYLNDEKLEGAVATGEGNLSALLRRGEGGISVQVGQ